MYKASTLENLFLKVGKVHRYWTGHLLEKHNIHRGQPPLLFGLKMQDGQTNSELANRMEVTPATISNMVKRMEKGGFVTRKRDPEDERVIRVYLTDRGREQQSEVENTLKIMNEIAFGNFSLAEREQFQQLLEKMMGNLHHAFMDENPSFDPEKC